MAPKFSDEIAQKYPYPLAIAVKRYHNAMEDVERFPRLAGIIEAMIRHLAALALAQ